MKVFLLGKKYKVVRRNDDGLFDLIIFHTNGSQFRIDEYTSGLSLDELPTDVYITFESSQLLISRESFFAAKRDILNLQVDEKVRLVGIWPDGTRLHHVLHLLEKGEQQNEYLIISVPEQHIQQVIEPLKKRIRLRACIPSVASIASLIGKLTSDPVLACILKSDEMEIVYCEKGLPFYSQITPFETLLSDKLSSISQEIFNVRQIIGSKIGKSVKKILIFNKNLEEIPKNLPDEQLWQPNLSDFFKEQDQDLFYRFPELLGAPFVSAHLNFLPSDLKRSYLIADLNKGAAIFALCGCFCIGALLPGLQQKYKAAKREYIFLKDKAQKRRSELIKKLPPISKVRQLSEILDMIDNIQEDPPLQQVLLNIAKALPDNVVISDISIKRENVEQEPEKQQEDIVDIQSQESEGAIEPFSPELQATYKGKPLIMELKIVTKGNFQVVKERLIQVGLNLGKFFELKQTGWNFKEDEKLGTLHFKGVLLKKNEK